MTDPDPKAALRLTARARRRELAAADPHAPLKAAVAFAEAPRPATHAALYLAQGSELDPLPLASVLQSLGAGLCLPAVRERDCALVFRRWSAGDAMTPDALNMPAPLADAPECLPDLIVAPLLAFDRQGRRLGQGGGYYDRTLQALRAHGDVFALGLAYAGQELDSLSDEPHDQRLDAILTEQGLILAGEAC